MSSSPDVLSKHYSVPAYVRNSLKNLAANNGDTINGQAVQVLENALPRVKEDLFSYKWPATRREYQRRGAWATVVVHLPRPLFVEYWQLAFVLAQKAVAEGRYYAGKDDFGQEKDSTVPTDWLMRQVLEAYTPNTALSDTPAPKHRPEPVAGGPLVQVSLPARVVAWMDDRQLNRSAFVRGAIEARLAPLMEGTVPPMSRLLGGEPKHNFPVRMSATMHERLKATASAKGVSMTHLMRAACLTHMAAQAAKATAPASTPTPTPQAEVPA